MKNRIVVCWLVVFALLLALSACGASTESGAPSTAAPDRSSATTTPERAPATTAPLANPSAAPATTSAAPDNKGAGGGTTNKPGDLRSAVTKTRASRVHRIGFNFNTGVVVNGQSKIEPFLVFDGEVRDNTNRIVYRGGAFNEILGGGNQIEMITTGNKTYMKGSNLFGTADPDKWYYLPDSAITQPPFDVEDLLLLTGEDFEKAKAVANDGMDGLNCQTWLWDFKNHAAPLLELTSGKDTSNNFNLVEKAETRFTVCGDGYVHQMEWNLVAYNANNTTEKGTLAIKAHMFDFNASNIVIKPPEGAIELK